MFGVLRKLSVIVIIIIINNNNNNIKQNFRCDSNEIQNTHELKEGFLIEKKKKKTGQNVHIFEEVLFCKLRTT